MKTIIYLSIILSNSLWVSSLVVANHYAAIEKYKNKEIQRHLLTRLNNANDLIEHFEKLPTECQEEIKLIIKHFRK